jgi:hypothetical protein
MGDARHDAPLLDGDVPKNSYGADRESVVRTNDNDPGLGLRLCGKAACGLTCVFSDEVRSG